LNARLISVWNIWEGLETKLEAFICRFVKVGNYELEMSKTENFPRLGTKTRPQDQDQN